MGQAEKEALETRRTRTRKEAYQEIKDIEYFIAVINGQPLNAVKVSEAIYATIRKIGISPFAFKECEHLPTKSKVYRQATCLSYLIIYKITKTEIIILSVTHSARNASEIKKLRGNY